MSDTAERKVLRSFYLSESLDERLRLEAFRLRESKGELVRRFVSTGLDAVDASATAKHDYVVPADWLSNTFAHVDPAMITAQLAPAAELLSRAVQEEASRADRPTKDVARDAVAAIEAALKLADTQELAAAPLPARTAARGAA